MFKIHREIGPPVIEQVITLHVIKVSAKVGGQKLTQKTLILKVAA